MHPAHLVGDEVLTVLQLWQIWRPSGFGGYGPLPCTGGAGDQPADLMAAFEHCSRVATIAKPPKSDNG